jgi:uncharacterized caspase-like protein
VGPLRRNWFLIIILLTGLTPAAMAQSEKKPPNLTVLTIGVSQYKAPGNDLKHAAKDARDLAAAFKLHEGKLFGRVQTKTITDGQASRQGIEEALDWLAKQVQPEDYVIVFVSGHGNIDSLGHYYFVPHDFEPGRERTAVRWTQFHETLSRLPGTRFLIVDTCRSGGAGGEGSQVSQTDSLKVLSAQGLITYAACMSGEFSYEATGSGPVQNGYFTCALIEALSGKADVNGDGVITLAEVDAYVANRVKALSRGLQNPTMQRPWTIPSSLALALTSSYVSHPTSCMPLANLASPSISPASSMPLADMQQTAVPATGPICSTARSGGATRTR